MRMTPVPPMKVEQYVAYLRAFGLVAGVVLALLTDFPDAARVALAWGTLVFLVIAGGGLAWWGRRTHWTSTAMVHVGFVVDVALISGYVLAYAHLDSNVSWSVVFTLLADAALRYGVRGAVLGTVLGALLYTAQAQLQGAAAGEPVGVTAYMFVFSTLVGIAGVLGTFSFVVARQAAAARAQALALADAQRVRERLIATSSHEFNGSLTAILLGAETVRNNVERIRPESARSALDEVAKQGRHLQRLVDDLLAAAQATSDDVGVRVRVEDVATTIDLAVAAAGRHQRRHRLEIAVDPVVCELDHERLQQIVRNLVENAFKYTPAGGLVRVTATHGADLLEVRVSDTGPGIAVTDRERIFEPFRRRASDPERADSAGLGLYLVKQIVDAMRGSLDLRTSAGGSEFVVRLPAPERSGVRPIGSQRRVGTAE
ncbi:MAG: hypothetical protein GEU96_11305 [Propionibacteriales bacterium]|nr:hypothetical protein [Propionibacteriales bacterium]